MYGTSVTADHTRPINTIRTVEGGSSCLTDTVSGRVDHGELVRDSSRGWVNDVLMLGADTATGLAATAYGFSLGLA